MTFRFTMFFCAALLLLPVLPALAGGARIAVPVRDIARGEIIADSDLTYGSAAPGQMRSGLAVSMADLSGMQARRYLRAGELVLTSDVRRPVLVSKGETVTMTVELPGVSLTATGRALSEGGLGESITVVNPVSYRQIMATVIGPGTVRAESAMATPAKPSRMALK